MRRRGLKDNIKLGAGGIREIESIVQVFQLIRGWSANLRCSSARYCRHWRRLMSCICCRKATTNAAARGLIRSCAGWKACRKSINDEQTQTLPQDELNRARLAWGMHTDDWETLSAQLANHMANVRRAFNELIGDDEAQSPDEQLAEYWRELWQDALEEDDASPGAGAFKRRRPPQRAGV
ncbi:hypothetical protein [Escherichia coli]|uniref:[protein-PII] uridylyltransferase family protein n=1 Tax=Escherichia coli TaxID=562 RepID=UPI003AAFE6EF